MKTTWEQIYYRWDSRSQKEIGTSISRNLSSEEIDILKQIENGENPSRSNDKNRNNTLTRLRRRGVIVNTGSRAYPKWNLVSTT